MTYYCSENNIQCLSQGSPLMCSLHFNLPWMLQLLSPGHKLMLSVPQPNSFLSYRLCSCCSSFQENSSPPPTPSSLPSRLKCPSERLSPDTCPEQGPSLFLPPYSVHFPHRLCNNFFGVATFLWFEGLPLDEPPPLLPWKLPEGHFFLTIMVFLHLAHIN